MHHSHGFGKIFNLDRKFTTFNNNLVMEPELDSRFPISQSSTFFSS